MKMVMLNPPRKRRRRRRRRNTWFGDREGHRKAALKGWRKRRGGGRKKRRTRKVARKKTRRKSRAKKRTKRSKRSLAARRGWAKRRARKRADPFNQLPAAYRKNPGRKKRRRRRRRNASFNYGTSYRQGTRKRKRNYSTWVPAYKSNPYWAPRYVQNPGVIGSVTRGFDLGVLSKAAPVAGGAIGNAVFSKWVKQFLPGMLQDGAGGLLTDLASAGVLGAGVGMINRGWGQSVFMGGVIETVMVAAQTYIMPLVGMSGLGDYLTVANAREAQPLGGCCGGLSGMSGGVAGQWGENMLTKGYLSGPYKSLGVNYSIPSFSQATGLDPYPYGMQGMGDYLTVNNAREAQALGAYPEHVAASELAMN